MTYLNSDGSPMTKTQLLALTSVVATDEVRVFTADIPEKYNYEGESAAETGRRTAFVAGQTMKTSDIDALFRAPAFTSITPATGPAAGGTKVTIKGDNLLGNKGVTLGGTAATNVVVLDRYTITCTAPAHAAGAVNVVVTDDGGSATGTNAFTYA